MPDDVVIPVAFYTLAVAGALGGGMVGYILSRESRSKRRHGLIIGFVIAVASLILHTLALIIWAGVLGALAGYVSGRFTGSREGP